MIKLISFENFLEQLNFYKRTWKGEYTEPISPSMLAIPLEIMFLLHLKLEKSNQRYTVITH